MANVSQRGTNIGNSCPSKERRLIKGIVLLMARVLLATVFGVTGLAKLADRAGSRQALLRSSSFRTGLLWSSRAQVCP